MAKRIVSIVIFILGISLLVSLTRSLWKLRTAQQRLSALEEEVGIARQEKESLKRVVDLRRTLDFVEQEARNRLQMVKKGEKLVVLPPEEDVTDAVYDQDVGSVMDSQKKMLEQLPPWKQWADLFGVPVSNAR